MGNEKTIKEKKEFKKKEFKKKVKLGLVIAFGIFLFIITLVGALAFTIDGDDEYYVKAGDSIEGVFVVEGFVPGTILASNVGWVSLDKDKYISEKAATGIKIIDDNYAIYYWVNIPADATVGIHRAVITVQAGEQVRYLNIKISVENPIINSIHKTTSKPSVRITMISIIILILTIILWVSYLRGKRR